MQDLDSKKWLKFFSRAIVTFVSLSLLLFSFFTAISLSAKHQFVAEWCSYDGSGDLGFYFTASRNSFSVAFQQDHYGDTTKSRDTWAVADVHSGVNFKWQGSSLDAFNLWHLDHWWNKIGFDILSPSWLKRQKYSRFTVGITSPAWAVVSGLVATLVITIYFGRKKPKTSVIQGFSVEQIADLV